MTNAFLRRQSPGCRDERSEGDKGLDPAPIRSLIAGYQVTPLRAGQLPVVATFL